MAGSREQTYNKKPLCLRVFVVNTIRVFVVNTIRVFVVNTIRVSVVNTIRVFVVNTIRVSVVNSYAVHDDYDRGRADPCRYPRCACP